MADESTELTKKLSLTKKALEVITDTLSDQIAGVFGKFAQFAEKGTVAFLLAAGITFMVVGVGLSIRSESLLDKELNLLMERQSESRRLPTSDNQTGSGVAAPQVSQSANGEGQTGQEPKTIISYLPEVVLFLCGTLLMLSGAATSLISYKWRLTSYQLDQPYRLELLREEAKLKSTTIDAVSKAGELHAHNAVHDEKV
jgi:hypothetical protein